MADIPIQPSYSPNLDSLTSEILADPQFNPPDAPAQTEATPAPEAQSAQPDQAQPQNLSQPPVQDAQHEPPPDPQEQERGYLRDKDYRQKTMALAQERREWEAQRAAVEAQRQAEVQRLQQYERAIHDPNFLAQRWQELQQAQAQIPDPNTPLTLGQVQQMLAQNSQALLNQTRQEQTSAFFEAEKERYRIEYQSDMSRAVEAAVKDNPILSRIPGMARVLDEEAKALEPKTVAEYKQHVKDRAEHHTKDWKKFITDHEQAAVMRHAQVSKPTINPPGGQIAATQAAPKHKFGSKSFHDSLQAELESGTL